VPYRAITRLYFNVQQPVTLLSPLSPYKNRVQPFVHRHPNTFSTALEKFLERTRKSFPLHSRKKSDIAATELTLKDFILKITVPKVTENVNVNVAKVNENGQKVDEKVNENDMKNTFVELAQTRAVFGKSLNRQEKIVDG